MVFLLFGSNIRCHVQKRILWTLQIISFGNLFIVAKWSYWRNGYPGRFVSRFEILYGFDNMLSNVHQLRHLPEVVRRNGPLLWATSYFPYENINGIMKNVVRSSNSPHLQMVKSIFFLPSGPKVPLSLPAPDCECCIFGLTRQKNRILTMGANKECLRSHVCFYLHAIWDILYFYSLGA